MEALFSVGDEVICIDSKNAAENVCPLIEGKKYPVLAMRVCRCGKIRVDVGVNSGLSTHCAGCKIENDNCEWTQFRFIKPETDQELSDEIHESLKIGITITP